MEKRYNTKFLIKSGVIAAIYVVLTIILGDLSYGPVQARISEAMTILPLYEAAAIPGLFIGCAIANFASGYGLVDIVFGSLTTLAAAYLTSKMPNKYLAVLPPILLNAFIVSIWVSKITKIPYIVNVGTIGFGEFLTAGILGVILASVFERVTKKDMR
ncbi:hypothetical protein Q428_01275 [Fervidicella metallireducens AeB]|uniref:QueT transporter family protein n=1 Tax=Fervidicella metallireducens AeB TaxID=1403537 RepID=A0A017RY26_9CLOT|nr:QueT transporter family protein [Fervidicella metallireducens]EYE89673.1 hypothetical protein Q428_01275 [Fervidicella metallireducens AeB]